MTRTRVWSILTAVVVVALLAAGWFLLIAPKRSKVAELDAERAAAEQRSATVQMQIDALKEKARALPQQRRRLEAFAVKLPVDVQLPTIVRTLSALGRDAGTDVTVITPQRPVAPNEAGGPTAAPATSSGTAAAPAGKSGYAVVPLSVTVRGSYVQIERFLSGLETTPRAFLVNVLSIQPATDVTSASDGGVALEATLTTSAFVASARPAPATGTTPADESSAPLR